MNQQQRDAAFIEETMKALGLESDGELEALASLSKHTLSKARTGIQPLSAFATAKLWDLRGYKWAITALSTLFGEKGRTWVKSEERRTKRRALKKLTGIDVDQEEK